MVTDESEVDVNTMEYKLGWKRYKYVREGIENILNKSYKRRIPQYTTMIALLDAIEDEYSDADVSKLIESIKDII